MKAAGTEEMLKTMTKRGFRSIILIVVTLLFGTSQLRYGSCDILIKPTYTEVLLHHSTYLNCSTSRAGQEIHWKHGEQHVYAGGQLFDPYSGRIIVEKDLLSGISNLIISSATPEDAGTYTCQENAGRGNYSSADLVVLGENKKCTTNVEEGGIIGANDCGLKTEDLLLSCNVSYYGNIPPKLEWRRAGEEVPFSLGRTQENYDNKAICNQTIRSDRHIDGSSYVCQSSRMVTKGNVSLCSSDAIKLFYVPGSSSIDWRKVGENISCSVNTSSQQCSFEWKWYSSGNEVTVSNDKHLTTNSTGLYRCEAKCNVKSSLSCSVLAMTVMVYATEPPDVCLGSSSIAWREVGEKVSCSVNTSSQQCSFKWKWYSGGKEVTVSNDKQLTTNSTGLYRCEADCNVKSSLWCRVVSMTVLVNAKEHAADKDLSYPSNSGLVAAVVVLIIILGFTAIAWLIYFCRSKQKKNLKKEEHERPLEEEKSEVVGLKKLLAESETEEERLLEKQLQGQENEQPDKLLRKELTQFSRPMQSNRLPSYRSSEDLEEMVFVCSISTNREKKVIKGLAVLDDEIFVVSQWSSTVEVYDIKQLPAKREKSRQFEALTNTKCDPKDIAASATTKSLFICLSYKDKEIITNYIVEVDKHGSKNKRWKTNTNGGRISVKTHDAITYVLLTVSGKNELHEYDTSNGQCVEIYLPNTYEFSLKLMHSLKLSAGHYFVGLRCDDHHELWVVDKDGKVKENVGEKIRLLGKLSYLASNNSPKESVIFVAEKLQSRIYRIKLEGTSTNVKKLVPQKRSDLDMRFTRRLCYVEKKQWLLVVDNDFAGEWVDSKILILSTARVLK